MGGVTPVWTYVAPNNTTQTGSTYKANIDGAFNTFVRFGDAFAPHEVDPTPNMTAQVDAGAIYDPVGLTLTEVAQQTTGTITAPVSHPRIDRVVRDASTGTISIITGVENASPVAPAITSGKVPIAQILLQTSSTSITNSMITDERPPTHASVTGLSSVADGSILANISGGSALPTANTLTAILDHVLGNTQGDIIYRGASTWSMLAPGTNHQVLQTGGAAANPSWTGISPVLDLLGSAQGDILYRGSGGWVVLAPGTSGQILETLGASSNPAWAGISTILDGLGSAQGDVLYRGASGWVVLAPGTSGQYLQTQGAGANLQWNSPAGSGTVTSVGTGTGLTGGPITGSGTISLASIVDGDLLANTSGGTAAPIATTLSALIDHVLGSARGDIIYRGASGWTVLAPGTSGYVLSTNGAGADPSWVAQTGGSGGSGTVTSVAVSSTDLSVSGSPITTSGTFTLNVQLSANTAALYALAQSNFGGL
jgi:hypothetical protein